MNDSSYQTHTTIVKNCSNSIIAQVKLEDYLKRKYPNFKQLVVFSCVEDLLRSIFGSLNGNPFGL